MSRLDLTLQEKVWLETNEAYKELTKVDDVLLKQENRDHAPAEIDLEGWLEVFEQDQVRVEGCR